MVHGDSKKDILTFIHVNIYYFLQMGRRKSRKFWKIPRITLKFTLFNEFLGGFMLHCGRNTFCEKYFHCLNRREKLCLSWVPCAMCRQLKKKSIILIMMKQICAKCWRRWSYFLQWSTGRKLKWKKIYHQQIDSCQSLGKLLESTLFRLSKMYTYYHWKQIIRHSQSLLRARFFSYLTGSFFWR